MFVINYSFGRCWAWSSRPICWGEQSWSYWALGCPLFNSDLGMYRSEAENLRSINIAGNQYRRWQMTAEALLRILWFKIGFFSVLLFCQGLGEFHYLKSVLWIKSYTMFVTHTKYKETLSPFSPNTGRHLSIREMVPCCHLVAKTRYRDHIDKMAKISSTAAKLYWIIIRQSRKKQKCRYKVAFWDVVMCFFFQEKTLPTLTKLRIYEII